MYPRRPDPLKLLMDAFFWHVFPLSLPLSVDSVTRAKSVSPRQGTSLHRHGLSRFPLPVNWFSSPRTSWQSHNRASQIENADSRGHPLAPSAQAVHGLNMLRTISQFRRVNNALGVNSKETAGEQLTIGKDRD